MRVLTAAFRPREAVTPDWEALYREHAPDLLRYLAKLTGQREEATELMQDTFVRAMSAKTDQIAAFRPWLFRIATNLAVTRVRRRRLFAFIPFHGTELAPGGAFDEDAYQVRAALRSVPPDQAATLLLHYQSGFTRAEIAAMQGLSEDGVKTRLARGRKNFIAAYRRPRGGLGR